MLVQDGEMFPDKKRNGLSVNEHILETKLRVVMNVQVRYN